VQEGSAARAWRRAVGGGCRHARGASWVRGRPSRRAGGRRTGGLGAGAARRSAWGVGCRSRSSIRNRQFRLGCRRGTDRDRLLHRRDPRHRRRSLDAAHPARPVPGVRRFSELQPTSASPATCSPTGSTACTTTAWSRRCRTSSARCGASTGSPARAPTCPRRSSRSWRGATTGTPTPAPRSSWCTTAAAPPSNANPGARTATKRWRPATSAAGPARARSPRHRRLVTTDLTPSHRRAHRGGPGRARRPLRQPHHLLAEGVHPLTMLCRDTCGYCTFAQPPARLEAPYLARDQVLAIARAGAEVGCHEALFTLGERPELRFPVAAQWLEANGYESTVDYLVDMCRVVLEVTGLLPHANAGALFPEELAALRGQPVAGDDGRVPARRPGRPPGVARQGPGPPPRHPRRRRRAGHPLHHRHPRRHRRDRGPTGSRPSRPSPSRTAVTGTCRR
jgi:hypothetical protein